MNNTTVKVLSMAIFLIQTAVLPLQSQPFRVFPSGRVPERYQDQNNFTYTLPETQLKIDITVETLKRIRGPLFADASLLNLSHVIMQDEEIHHISNVHITATAQPDESHSYVLIPREGNLKLKIAPNGMLEQLQRNATATIAERQRPITASSASPTVEPSPLLNTIPSVETKFLKKSMYGNQSNLSATEIAETIKKLRQDQIDILAGSVEGTFLNTTVDFMYKQLDEVLHGYISLFTGLETVHSTTYTFYIIPERSVIKKEQHSVAICTFSEKTGIGTVTQSNTAPIVYLHLQEPAAKASAAVQAASRKRSEKKGIGLVYRMPKQTMVTLSCGEKEYPFLLPIAQYGTIKTLPKEIQSVTFNPITGALESCETKEKVF